MMNLLRTSALTSLMLAGAIFGFFYAWICSTMWGLDATDPRVAIGAMQAMNTSVRNVVFAPAFFATPFVLILTGIIAWRVNLSKAAILFGLAGVIYLFGGMILTVTVNVPMNVALGQVVIPEDIDLAQQIWSTYSKPWQIYNIIRTVVSGVALLLTGLAIFQIGVGNSAQKV